MRIRNASGRRLAVYWPGGGRDFGPDDEGDIPDGFSVPPEFEPVVAPEEPQSESEEGA